MEVHILMLIKKKKTTTINPVNDDNRCFQYVFNIFINNYNWKGIKYPSKIEDWKNFEKKKKIQQLLSIFCILKKKKYAALIFQKLIHTVKKK